MNHRYNGRTPVKRGQKVDLIDVDMEVYETIKVHDVLATQFTVLKKQRTRYFFYQDKGITWRPHQ